MAGILHGNAFAMGIIDVIIDPASVATITTAEQDFTVPGLKAGDMVFVNKPSLTAGLGIAGCRVKAADTLSITFVNPTAGSLDAASETYKVLYIRPNGGTAASAVVA